VSRAARRPALVAASIAALLLARALPPGPLATRATEGADQADPVPSACRVQAEVSISPKLVCPNQPVAVRFRVRTTCPTDRAELRVDALRLVAPYPEGIIAYEPDPGGPALPDGDDHPEPWRYEISDEVPPEALVTLWVRPLYPGAFDVGGAEVEIVDTDGRMARAASAPARLVVSEGCTAGRRSAVYLPTLLSPSCVPSTTPTDFALVLDRSSSIGAAGLAAELSATAGFIDQLVPGRDRAALVVFDERAELVAPLGTPPEAMRAALASLAQRPAAAGSRLDRAIEAGLDALGAASARRGLIVLISDGVHFGPGGTAPVLRAAERARDAGTRIATILVGSVTDRALMARITTAPGLSLVAHDGVGLASAFRDLADETGTICTN